MAIMTVMQAAINYDHESISHKQSRIIDNTDDGCLQQS